MIASSAGWVRHHWGNVVAYGIVVVTLVAILFSMQSQFDELDKRTTPYHPVTISKVTATPMVIPRSGTVSLSFRFCNNTDGNADGITSLSWEAIDPHGHWIPGQAQTLFTSIDPGPIAPGCVQRTIPVRMPVTAQHIDLDLDVRRIAHSWKLTGGFSPINPDGSGFGGRAPLVTGPINVTG